MKRSGYIFLLIGLSVTLRVLFLYVFQDVTPQDTDGYDRWSHDILSSDGILDASMFRRAPGYSVFLAILHLAFGHSIFVIQLFQVALGALTVVLVYLLAEEILYSFWPMVCGVFAAMSFNLISLCHGMLSENVYVPLLLLGLLYAVRHSHGKSGVALALATLTRPQGILAVAAVCLWKPSIAFVVAFLVVMTPWVIRNQMVYNKPVLVNLQAGSVFWGSNNPLAEGRWINLQYFGEPEIDLPPLEANSFAWNQGIDYLQTIGVIGTIKLIAKRYLYFLFPAGRIGETRWVDMTFILLLPFTAFGFFFKSYWVYWVKNHHLLVLLRVFTVFFLAKMLLFAQFGTRFRAPLEPVLILFAVSTLQMLWLRMSRRNFMAMNITWVSTVLIVSLTPLPRLIWQHSKELLGVVPI